MGRFVDSNGDPIKVDPSREQPDHVTEPVPGKNLTLTVDLGVQKLAENELDAAIARTRKVGYPGRGGAVVAMDPRNGDILALASRPNFDPQLFVGGVSGKKELKEYNYLTSDASNHPFIDQAITAGEPAASTFKTFTGLAGLVSGVINRNTTYTDDGSCWHPIGILDSPCYQSWRDSRDPRHRELRPSPRRLQRQVLLPGGRLDLGKHQGQGVAAPLLRTVRLRLPYRHRPAR
jgi:penicillin-binding protein 2